MSRLRSKGPTYGHGQVTKSWGSEEWVVNNDEYCGKVLRFRPGTSTSLHFHVLKHETMYCTEGFFEIVLVDPETAQEYSVVLNPGDSLEIPRNQVHRIHACRATVDGVDLTDDAVLFEFSTHHEDSDSYRVMR